MFLNKPLLDCERSLFSSKIHLEERKTSKCASVAVRLTRGWRCLEPLVARAWEKLARHDHAHSHARTPTCFVFLPTDFRGKETLLGV